MANTLNYSNLGAMTFDDEFNSLHLYDGKSGWKTNYGYNGDGVGSFTLPGNGEQEVYTAPGFKGSTDHDLGLNPYSISNGVLDIAARPTPDNLKGQVWNLPYTSGMLTTKDTFSQKYGYFEMRAELPSGKGLWPAFWLLPQDGSWPPELDVMEQLGNDPSTIYTTVHTSQTGQHVADGLKVSTVDTSQGFHNYGVMWAPDKITWYVDGQQVYQTNTPADMNKPMYMLANLAVGGGWPGSPDGSTHFPADMKIDYIRAYNLPGDGSSGGVTPPPTSGGGSTTPPTSGGSHTGGGRGHTRGDGAHHPAGGGSTAPSAPSDGGSTGGSGDHSGGATHPVGGIGRGDHHGTGAGRPTVTAHAAGDQLASTLPAADHSADRTDAILGRAGLAHGGDHLAGLGRAAADVTSVATPARAAVDHLDTGRATAHVDATTIATAVEHHDVLASLTQHTLGHQTHGDHLI